MQRTTNYNFKKPDYTDFADIQDINDNMDAIDAELAAPTGDLANATIKSSTASTASYPVPAANDTMKVMLGKIIKFCADIVKTFTGATSTKAGAKGLVPAPTANQHTRFLRADGTWREPVNGAGTTTAGDVLDARMGKTLNDKINTLNDSLAVTSKLISDGIYGTFRAYRYGRMLTYQWDGVGTAPTTEPYQLPETLPTALQPIYNISAPMRMWDNTLGYFTVDTDGVVSIYANKKSWSSGNASVIAKS